MDILEVEGNFLDFLILSCRLGTDVMYDVTKTIEADQELFEQHYDGQCLSGGWCHSLMTPADPVFPQYWDGVNYDQHSAGTITHTYHHLETSSPTINDDRPQSWIIWVKYQVLLHGGPNIT